MLIFLFYESVPILDVIQNSSQILFSLCCPYTVKIRKCKTRSAILNELNEKRRFLTYLFNPILSCCLEFFERYKLKHKIFDSVFLKYFSNTFQYSFVFLHTIYRNDVQNEFKSGMFKTETIFQNIFRD